MIWTKQPELDGVPKQSTTQFGRWRSKAKFANKNYQAISVNATIVNLTYFKTVSMLQLCQCDNFQCVMWPVTTVNVTTESMWQLCQCDNYVKVTTVSKWQLRQCYNCVKVTTVSMWQLCQCDHCQSENCQYDRI